LGEKKLKQTKEIKRDVYRLKKQYQEPSKILEEFEFNLKKGQAEYWMKKSLERPLTHTEFLRYKQLCNELGLVTEVKN
jgi:hypothetical protein